MNANKALETKAGYLALLTAFFLLALNSLPSFQLGKLWDGMATLGVCLAMLVASIGLFWEFLPSPAWRKPVIMITAFGIVSSAAITFALLSSRGYSH
jgi:hypothetical protein